jgi:hypothetical protein
MGAPWDHYPQRWHRNTVVISTSSFIFNYYSRQRQLPKLACLPVILGMWSSTIILLPLGNFHYQNTRRFSRHEPDSYGVTARKMTLLFNVVNMSHENPSVNQ